MAVVLVAHRAANNNAPLENTLAALDEVYKKGFRHVEIDCHRTLDDQVVVMHDETIDRTTGKKGVIAHMNYPELSKIKIAGREKIPLLSEFLSYCKAHKIGIAIEAKPRDDKLVALIDTLVRQEACSDLCKIYSFDLETLKAFQKLHPSYSLHWTHAPPFSEEAIPLAKNLGFGLNLEVSIASKERIRTCKQLGIPVHIWTVNDEKGYNYFQEQGVDAILTDRLLPTPNSG